MQENPEFFEWPEILANNVISAWKHKFLVPIYFATQNE